VQRLCPLLGVKQTWLLALQMSAYDPKRTSRVQCEKLLVAFYSICGVDDLIDVRGLTLAVSRTSDANITDRGLARRLSVAERPIALPPVSVGGMRAMPQPHNFNRTAPPIGKQRCPMCGLPMFLSLIEPSDEIDRDERTFECSTCAYAETITVNFR
jgi:hypothetical protein